ncbi:MAG: sodium:solute symporter family protein [Gammaproteobacteria bacterium]|nr:sodium:solute symporter family protein [Gammaproteobacteria bacterium]
MAAKTLWLFTFLALYWSYCIFWGIRGALIPRTAPERYIAGRSIPAWIFILAATATSFSGWTFIGHAGLVYRDGFPYAYASFYAVVIPLTGVLLFKRQWLLGRRFGFTTPGEMLAAYYASGAMRMLTVLVALLFTIPYLAVQLRASGYLFNILTDGLLGVDTGMWLLAAFILLYALAGGLRAAAVVDMLQTLLLAAGLIAVGLICLHQVGGWDRFMEGLAVLGRIDPRTTAEGHSHLLATPGAFQPVGAGTAASGGPWTGTMTLSYLIGLLGLQAAPAFSLWVFSASRPNLFAPQQVWASALGIGLILMVFTVLTGFGAHFLGADAGLAAARPDLVTPLLADDLARLGARDILATAHGADQIVPLLIDLMADNAAWLVGLLAMCAVAVMQATGTAFLNGFGRMLEHDLLRRLAPRASADRLSHWTRASLVVVMIGALATAGGSSDALVLVGGVAVAYALQMGPALVGLCWWRWLTRTGVVAGMAAGMAAVTLTDTPGLALLAALDLAPPWGRWPLTIHSAGWGIGVNLALTVALSALTQSRTDRDRQAGFHAVLLRQAALTPAQQRLAPLAWMLAAAWFWFAVGPGSVLGNTLFGDPGDRRSWVLGIPSIWAWQILWWLLGVGLVALLAYRLGLSTLPDGAPGRSGAEETPQQNRRERPG